MHSTSDELQIPARRLDEDNDAIRAELESKLAPLMSLVLQTGRASPSLLQWVRLTLAAETPSLRLGRRVDCEWAALHLARQLSLKLLHDVCPQRDSVANRQTLVGTETRTFPRNQT